MNFLTPVLKENFELLRKKMRLPDFSIIDRGDAERRARVIELGTLLPGLRMCERRSLLLLAQSAPLVELANLHQTLEHLEAKVDAVWPDVTQQHETVIERSLVQIRELYKFAEEIEEIYVRREAALRLLEVIDVNGSLSRQAPGFEPVYNYLGYEVAAISHALNATKYPDAILEASKVNF
jgi:hypothetical protein